MDWQNQNRQNNPYNNGSPYSNGNPYNNLYRVPRRPSGDSLANAALVTGIIAIVSFVTMTVYLPFIFGSISIVLALLSRGRASKLTTKAKSGIFCAILGILCNIAMIGVSFYMLFYVPGVKEQVNEVFTQMYGTTFEEMYEDILNGENPYDNRY